MPLDDVRDEFRADDLALDAIGAGGQHRVSEGHSYPLGATPDESGTNFALFSAHATKVELCLFNPDGTEELERIELGDHTDQIFHGHVSGVKSGAVYGYRVHGPYAPREGHRFNPNKLLIDPYARQHVGALRWDPAIFGYQLETGDDLTFDERDSAAFVPKGVVVNVPARPAKARKPTSWRDTVVYEAHVKGTTQLHPEVPAALRGKYAGLGSTAVLDHIRSLGVTAVELLPIHAFVDDSHLLERGLVNYWGYNTIGFFAPEPRYAADPATAIGEFRQMAESIHGAGLELILDVVFNHTAEGNERGPTLSFKGIDNRSYYRLMPEEPRYYINDSGTGNTVNLTHARVVQLVTDSLRYWATEMGVDGFRFDLSTVLAREIDGFNREGGFLKAVGQDPVLRSKKLIAEPWDCGIGGYQVGRFPPGWAEWNDKFRDTARDFWRGEALPGAFAPYLCGSGDLFNHDGRRPWSSVNFITAHDGFTLRDLVSFNDKHNEANGEENRDGTSDNRSWNCGAEGPTDDAEIKGLRLRQKKNMLATLYLAQGTPMLVAGDETGRTQQGNNNAYCQDNELSWLPAQPDGEGQELLAFVRRLAEIRAAYPVLRSPRFLTGARNDHLDLRDLAWISQRGDDMTEDDWANPDIRCFGMLVDGRAFAGGSPSVDPTPVLLLLNAQPDDVSFVLPPANRGTGWSALLSTGNPVASDEGAVSLPPRSLALFALRP